MRTYIFLGLILNLQISIQKAINYWQTKFYLPRIYNRVNPFQSRLFYERKKLILIKNFKMADCNHFLPKFQTKGQNFEN